MTHPLDQFQKQTYLNLETYRKSGEAMKTPVWFCQEGEVLYVRTIAHSGKVKRIKNNPLVRVVPCGMGGEVRGEWVDASAQLVDEKEAERINGLLSRKYGLIKWLFELFSKREKQVVLAVRLRGQS
jgi:uncharacterized protein